MFFYHNPASLLTLPKFIHVRLVKWPIQIICHAWKGQQKFKISFDVVLLKSLLNGYFLFPLRNFLRKRGFNNEWETRDIQHPLQHDGVSCGVYVLKARSWSPFYIIFKSSHYISDLVDKIVSRFYFHWKKQQLTSSSHIDR